MNMPESFFKYFLAESEVEKQHVVFQENFLVSVTFFTWRKMIDTTQFLKPQKLAICKIIS